MKFINTDGMAFIGPGSEWLWTAVSGIVLAGTFLAIFRQLRLQRSADKRDQLDSFIRDWDSERMLRHRLAILMAVRDGVDPTHLPVGSVIAVGTFWERVAQLARRGDQDPKAILATYRTTCQSWWLTLAPNSRWWRVEGDNPEVLNALEWLAGLADEMDRRAGRPVFDDARNTIDLAGRITYCEQTISIEQALRTVVIASPADPTVAGSAAVLTTTQG